MRKSGDPFRIQNEITGIRSTKIPGFSEQYQSEELGGVYDELKEGKIPGSSSNLEKKIKNKRLFFFWMTIFSFLVVFELRLVYIQLIKGNEYQNLAVSNSRKVIRVIPSRGLIYDSHGTRLVDNVSHFQLVAHTNELQVDDKEKINRINIISKLFKIPVEKIVSEIDEALEEERDTIIIAEGFDNDIVIKMSLIEEEIKGFEIVSGQRREYHNSEATAHVLGYVGNITESEWEKIKSVNNRGEYEPTDKIGKVGLESFYEEDLRGSIGKQYIEVDAHGKDREIIYEELFEEGKSLELTIDNGLQNKVYESMNEQKKGAAVAIDPRNGAIRALVSIPSFDANKFSKGISDTEYQALISNKDLPLFNRAISAQYPSGSTIKPVIAVAALNEGIIKPNTVYLSTGGIRINQWFFPDWKAGGHGRTNVIKAISDSVNTFFYIIGGGYKDIKGLGVKRISSYMRQFGLGSTLGIDLNGEASGFVPSKDWKEREKKENWYIGDTYHLAIGQGDLLVTPLQAALYTAAIANKGFIWRPFLVEKKINSEGEVVWQQKPTLIKKVQIEPKYFETIQLGMRRVVTQGTAQLLQYVPVSISGKTGTAQAGGDKEPHAWFTSYIASENPELVLAVVIENGGEGSSVAAPIAYEILNWYASERILKE